MKGVFNDTYLIVLPDFWDLKPDVTIIDTFVNELSNLQGQQEIYQIFWEYLQYALISLVMLGFVC